MYELRDYQKDCIEAHFRYFENRTGNPLFVVPTGGGKSLIIAEFVKRAVRGWSEQRVIVLTHVKELIQQNHAEFCQHWGLLAPVGIFSAGIKRRDTDDPVIFAGIQSVYDKPELLGRFDLCLIDEAHLTPKRGEGRYRKYIESLREMNSAVKVVGYTATPFRLDGGLLHKGEGRVFTDVAYEVPVEKLIKDEYLVPIVSKQPHKIIDTSGVGSQTGDFKRGELERAAMAGDCVELAVKELVEIAREQDRKHWLIFACGRDHAGEILAELRDVHGVNAEIILGNTPRLEREQIIRRAKNGEITALVNVNVLTTGFNWVRCDLLGVMRATESTALYVQIYGRGMRPFPAGEKKNCLALDYGGNVLRHGPLNRIDVTFQNPGESDEPKAKVCPRCNEIVELGCSVCESCGYEFPIQERNFNHESEASTAQPLEFKEADFTPKEPDMVQVAYVYYERHVKIGKPDSLRVVYGDGYRQFREWICLEHGGFALRKAEKWWRDHGGISPVPKSVTDAIERQGELKTPSHIGILQEGKYDRVVDYLYAIEEEEESQWQH